MVGKATEEHINCAAEAAFKAKETFSIKLVGILEKSTRLDWVIEER